MLLTGIGLILVAVAFWVTDLLGYAPGGADTVNTLLLGALIVLAIGVLRSSRHRHDHSRHSAA